MAQYKAVVTVSWKFDCEEDDHALEAANGQLASIMKPGPHDGFERYGVKMDLVRMRDRKSVTHIGMFGIDDVLPYVCDGDARREYKVGGRSYHVKMGSERYHLFKKGLACVACGLVGTKMGLDLNYGDQTPHFNLYAEEDGRLVLMTRDHVVPRSEGGADVPENLATMCSVCNNLKASHPLTPGQVGRLRAVYGNQGMLPRKELRELINKTVGEMLQETRTGGA